MSLRLNFININYLKSFFFTINYFKTILDRFRKMRCVQFSIDDFITSFRQILDLFYYKLFDRLDMCAIPKSLIRLCINSSYSV